MTDTAADRDGFGILARLSLSIDALTKSHDTLAGQLRRPPPTAVYRPVQMAGPYPSSGVLAFDLGGPDLGEIWHVRSLAVGGQTVTTAAAGRVDVFSGSGTPIIGAAASGDQPGSPGFQSGSGYANGSLLNWRDTASSLPNVAFYSVGDLVVLANQTLWVVIANGTAAQVYQVSGVVEQQQDAAYRTLRL